MCVCRCVCVYRCVCVNFTACDVNEMQSITVSVQVPKEFRFQLECNLATLQVIDRQRRQLQSALSADTIDSHDAT